MVTFQCETLYDLVEEIGPLLELHHQELSLNKDRVKLQPCWERYAALEADGAFVIYTARDDGRLVGYSAFFISVHRHHAELTVAQNDALFVHPKQRGRTGIGLIRFCETELTKRVPGAKITWHAKFSNNLSVILDRIGYAREEVVHSKFLRN